MARIRSIKPAFFTSEDTCRCSPLARLLFLGLLTEADKAGLVEDRPWQLKIRLLPNDDCDVDALLWDLADRRLVRRFEANGKLVIAIVNFEKHQRPHPKEAESQLPKEGADRVRPDNSTADREKVNSLPVEYPSCPARNGSGDLGYGVSDQEGKGAGTTTSPPLVSGESHPRNWGKIHGEHVVGFCDWVCLPDFIFAEFTRKSPGSDYVKGWAAAVRGRFEGQNIGDNLKFWRARWAESHPEEPVVKTFSVADALAREAARKAGTR